MKSGSEYLDYRRGPREQLQRNKKIPLQKTS